MVMRRPQDADSLLADSLILRPFDIARMGAHTTQCLLTESLMLLRTTVSSFSTPHYYQQHLWKSTQVSVMHFRDM